MLNKNRLFLRTARLLSRGGFTLVELLVVIGIIAILAGVALGPITNGIKQAKHNASMQLGRQIGQVCFSYATDNVQNGNAYPSAANGYLIAQALINGNYVTDPSVFVVSGQPSAVVAVPVSDAFTLVSSNCSWSFTVNSTATTGGLTSSASDLIPLIYFNTGVATPTPIITSIHSLGGGAAVPTTTALNGNAPFGSDGAAIFYKGNNAVYVKAGPTAGIIANFVSANCTDTTTYTVAP